MRGPQFWRLVDAAAAAEPHAAGRAAQLQAALAALPPGEIASFDDIWERTFRSLHTWELSGAAFVIADGCTDDMFDYFKAFVIAHGERAVQLVKRAPDALAHTLGPDAEIEDWELCMYPAWTAFETATGHEITLHPRRFQKLAGKRWQQQDLPRLYPLLSERFSAPRERSKQILAQNPARQAELAAAGDRLEAPRRIYHSARFPTQGQASRALAVLAAAGYGQTAVHSSAAGCAVEFAREDPLDGDNPERFSQEIIFRLHHYEGSYEGWRCRPVR